MIIENVKIIRDEDISSYGKNFFTIIFEYEFHGNEDETILECVPQQEVHLAIEAFMKDPINFREMYP